MNYPSNKFDNPYSYGQNSRSTRFNPAEDRFESDMESINRMDWCRNINTETELVYGERTKNRGQRKYVMEHDWNRYDYLMYNPQTPYNVFMDRSAIPTRNIRIDN